MKRKLGTFEHALYLSDLHSPFNVIGVLVLKNAPPEPSTVYSAIQMLQERHPFLRSIIQDGWFIEQPHPGIEWWVQTRTSDIQWKRIVETEMNSRLNPSKGLFRCNYIFSKEQSELVITFHHAIIDAASGYTFLDELLKACVSAEKQPSLPLLPPLEERFPDQYTGWKGKFITAKYAAAQMADEIGYWYRVRGKRIPPVQLGAKGFIHTLHLPTEFVNQLSQKCRRERVTFNTLLNAAQVLAVNRLLYKGESTPMRTFTFADLRPYCVPPTTPENLGNYISMLRFSVSVGGEDQIWALARGLQDKIYAALKHGDKFSAARMSESLMKIFLTVKKMRMGSAGLNYSGAVPLCTTYGDIHLDGIHIFMSSYDIGPEVSSQARIYRDSLWWDFMFLESDMNRETAEKFIREVAKILLDNVTG